MIEDDWHHRPRLANRLAILAASQAEAARRQTIQALMDLADALKCEDEGRDEVAGMYLEGVYHRSRHVEGLWQAAGLLTLIWLLR